MATDPRKRIGLRALAKPAIRKPRDANRNNTNLTIHSSMDPLWHYAPYVASIIPAFLCPSFFGHSFGITINILRTATGILTAYFIIEVIFPRLLFKQGTGDGVRNNIIKKVSKPRLQSKSTKETWDDEKLVFSILNHQFDTILNLAAVGVGGEMLKCESVMTSLIDNHIDLHLFDNVNKIEWVECCGGDVEVKTTSLANNPWQIVYGHVIVDASVSQLLSLLADDSKRQSYDKMFQNYEDHRLVGEGHHHSHQNDTTIQQSNSLKSGKLTTLTYNGAWPVANREFIVLSGWKPYWNSLNKTLGVLISTRSITPSSLSNGDYNNNNNKASNVIGTIYIAGFKIEPIIENGIMNENKCDVTFISHIDFGGNVSFRMINFVQSSVMPDILRSIKELAPKEENNNTNLLKAADDYNIKLN